MLLLSTLISCGGRNCTWNFDGEKMEDRWWFSRSGENKEDDRSEKWGREHVRERGKKMSERGGRSRWREMAGNDGSEVWGRVWSDGGGDGRWCSQLWWGCQSGRERRDKRGERDGMRKILSLFFFFFWIIILHITQLKYATCHNSMWWSNECMPH